MRTSGNARAGESLQPNRDGKLILDHPELRKLVTRETAEGLELVSRLVVEVSTAMGRLEYSGPFVPRAPTAITSPSAIWNAD